MKPEIRLELIKKITDRLNEARKIAIFVHIRPDGDAIGAALALGLALTNDGKTVRYVSQDPIPEKLLFMLDESDAGETFHPHPADCDCTVLVDISDLERAGATFADRQRTPDICIDHHISNPGIATINLIEPDSPATCAIIAKMLPEMGFPITSRIATALMTGILCDTQGFSTSNVDANTLLIAADLMNYGVSMYALQQKTLKAHSFAAGKYWALGLNKARLEGGVVWSVLTCADRVESGYAEPDDAELVNFLSATEEAKIAVLFVEMGFQEIKVSWRAKPGYNVSQVAELFNGGGHAAASGASMKGSLDQIIQGVLVETIKEAGRA